eukprot:gnl/Dysnectes_brevis/4680_a6408_578.p1 GENE.gnl/Dysnectes_brevis/4680_a6408_578~~gnl/Dysnectes_brevis/4680_a6408_578.p1  ORF type:complete len:648 (-),score=98.79 gnl/Dysnectes_brevis/4680_a6408_578:933-2876(-)
MEFSRLKFTSLQLYIGIKSEIQTETLHLITSSLNDPQHHPKTNTPLQLSPYYPAPLSYHSCTLSIPVGQYPLSLKLVQGDPDVEVECSETRPDGDADEGTHHHPHVPVTLFEYTTDIHSNGYQNEAELIFNDTGDVIRQHAWTLPQGPPNHYNIHLAIGRQDLEQQSAFDWSPTQTATQSLALDQDSLAIVIIPSAHGMPLTVDVNSQHCQSTMIHVESHTTSIPVLLIDTSKSSQVIASGRISTLHEGSQAIEMHSMGHLSPVCTLHLNSQPLPHGKMSGDSSVVKHLFMGGRGKASRPSRGGESSLPPSSMSKALQEAWKAGVLVGGHRGGGSNKHHGQPTPVVKQQGKGNRCPVAENTPWAFELAHHRGLDMVEFDVVCARDGLGGWIPVINHNFIIARPEGGVAHIHTLHHRQFVATPIPRVHPTARRAGSVGRWGGGRRRRREQGAGAGAGADVPEDEVADYPLLGPSGRPTLKDLTRLPAALGFNVELKWPTPALPGFPTRLETLTAVLKVLSEDRYVDQRKVFFSSFDPMTCLVATASQSRYPVLLLCCGDGTPPAACDDVPIYHPAALSASAAVAFAIRWGLQGVVLSQGSLWATPSSVEDAHGSGLLVLTYGTLGGDSSLVERQVQVGVDGIICDFPV